MSLSTTTTLNLSREAPYDGVLSLCLAGPERPRIRVPEVDNDEKGIDAVNVKTKVAIGSEGS